MVALEREQPRRTIAGALARAGWRVTPARTGQEALDVALLELPELIVVDVELEPVGGLHAALAIARLRSASYTPRLVLVSAKRDEATIALAKAAGAARVLLVPDEDPRASEEKPQPSTDLGRRQPRPGELWIVDDSQAIRLLVRHAFEREGWRVSEFDDLASAQTAAKASGPEAIVLDIHLPDGNGLDHIRRFAASGAAIVVVSNLAGPEQVERAFAAGAADLVSKPFDLRSLVARVTRALQQTPPSVVTNDVVPSELMPISSHEASVVLTHWG